MWETNVKKWEAEVFERGIERGIEKGVEKGIEKGIEKGKIEGARKLIMKGMDNSFIREITGLSLKKIRELRAEKR